VTHHSASFFAALAGVVAASAGVALALANGNVALAVAASAAPLVVLAGARAVPVVLRLLEIDGSHLLGLAWLLLVVSTFVWRGRTTDALVSNPLDGAALIRVGFVALAGLLLLPFVVRAPARRLPLEITLLIAFLAVALVGTVGSPLPLHAFYRVAELSVGLAAALAVAAASSSEWRKPLDLVLVCLGSILAVAWVEAVVVPARGWETVNGVVDRALIGYYPSFSSNGLGAYGAVLAIWGIAHLGAGRYRRWVVVLAAVGGVATLLATQYRTGVIGFLLALAWVVWQRRRLLLAFVVLAAALLVVASGNWTSLRTRTEVVFARGNPEAVANLDSRTFFWHAAEPSIRERPVFGWGLNVGSRHVLAGLGLQNTSTIHSTWFEALLGVGVVGTILLAGAYLALLAAALAREHDPDRAAAVGILVVLLVRSLTGSTIELFDLLFLLFVALALAVRAPPTAGRHT
jgi:O-antigen ligase